MKKVNEIYAEFLLEKFKFYRAIEHDIYRDALMFYMDRKFSTSANLCAVLYEMIFTTRLLRETANPPDFIPSRANIDQQFVNLIERENEIINVQRLSFRKITGALVNEGVISKEEKTNYDTFYTDFRNPVAHGLTYRLFELFMGRTPTNPFEIDLKYNTIYEKASEILINKIYDLMAIKVLLKK
jgi:hypothetical protein